MGTKEDHRTYCFQVQDVKDYDKEYTYFMGRWEKRWLQVWKAVSPLGCLFFEGRKL